MFDKHANDETCDGVASRIWPTVLWGVRSRWSYKDEKAFVDDHTAGKKKYHPESVSISKRSESAESLLNSIDGPKTPIVFIRF